MIGTTLSHYEIVDELGRGGMGVVYKAIDTRLDRTVAVKVLPSAALSSEDDRARFYREAKAAAQLNHPHIASIFDSDEAVPTGSGPDDARPFIVMEFIDGDSLADRIEAGPLTLSEVVRIATEMAQALDAAHEKGIVHRDIKPQNVMLTAKGDVKVLDFGLAKTAASTMLTRQGSTLGTVAYMSPEQARGEEVDRRTDLWALGVVCYEMLTGRHPFAREYEQAVIYSILNEDPEPVTALRSGLSMELEHIVDKAMAKDVELRYQTAAGFISDLKAAGAGSGVRRTSGSSQMTAAQRSRPDRQNRLPLWGWGVAIAALLVGIVGTWIVLGDDAGDEKPVMRLGLQVLDRDLPPTALTVSPSGSYLAFSDNERVFVRDLATAETWEIPEAKQVNRIVFTRDEEWLILETPGMILKSRLRDGTPFELTTVAASFPTVVEAHDGALIYEGGGRIWRIGPSGEGPALTIETDSSIFYNEPTLTPDGMALLVQEVLAEQPTKNGVFEYPSGRRKGEIALQDGFSEILDTGHIVFLRDGELYAVPFDWEEPRLLGPAIPLGFHTKRAAWSVAAGHLFYAPVRTEGETVGFAQRYFRSVRWNGSETELPPATTFYEEVHLDRTGRRAVTTITEGQRDIWVVDLFTGLRVRITTGSSGSHPSWHPSADSILYVASPEEGVSELMVRAADGSGEGRSVYRMYEVRIEEPRWSPDGSHVLFSALSYGSTGRDIWQLDLDSGAARPVIGGRGDQGNGAYSPDGRFVVYDGPAENQQTAVWLQSTEFDALPWQVSTANGGHPRWSPDGSGIYYMSESELMRVDVDTGVSPPRMSEARVVRSFAEPVEMWDLMADGTGLIHVVAARTDAFRVGWADSSGVQVHAILNWTEELKRLVPVPE